MPFLRLLKPKTEPEIISEISEISEAEEDAADIRAGNDSEVVNVPESTCSTGVSGSDSGSSNLDNNAGEDLLERDKESESESESISEPESESELQPEPESESQSEPASESTESEPESEPVSEPQDLPGEPQSSESDHEHEQERESQDDSEQAYDSKQDSEPESESGQELESELKSEYESESEGKITPESQEIQEQGNTQESESESEITSEPQEVPGDSQGQDSIQDSDSEPESEVTESKPEEFELKYDFTSGKRYVDLVSTKTEFDKMLDELASISKELLEHQADKFAKQYTGKFKAEDGQSESESDARKYEAFLGGYIANAAIMLYDKGYQDAALKQLEQAKITLETKKRLEEETAAIHSRVEENNDVVDLSDILGLFGDG